MPAHIVAANWKMYKTPSEALQFFAKFLPEFDNVKTHNELMFFVPALVLSSAVQAVGAKTQISLGVQNIYFEKEGAFTGENSPSVALEMGAKACLIGHSERRTFFAETDEACAKKIKIAQELGLTPMLCVGETLAEREGGRTSEVITSQLKKATVHLDSKKKFVLAYEPVWAIGTGKVATTAQASEAHGILRESMASLFGREWAHQVSILYGGSVKPENANELASQKNIDGFLVGGASLKTDSFLSIARANFA